jgi:polar amino acid transport system substrate-binding protein
MAIERRQTKFAGFCRTIFQIVSGRFTKSRYGVFAKRCLPESRLSKMQKKGFYFYTVAGLSCLFVLLASCQANGETWQRIEAAGVLKVGLDPTYPPFEAVNDEGLFGLDVDLAKALAADLGLTTEFVLFGYDGLYDALGTQQVDVLISGMVIFSERTRDFAYSEPYFNAGQILVTRADTAGLQQLSDFNGRTLAVELGAQGHIEATTWSRRLADLTVLPYPTPDEALTAVLNREADAALVDSISGRLYLMTEPGLVRGETAVTVEPFAVVVRAEDELLLEKVNQSLDNLRASGQLEQIISKWLGP